MRGSGPAWLGSKSMGYKLELVGEYLVPTDRPCGKLPPEVEKWCYQELKKDWVSIYSISHGGAYVEFEDELEMMLFKFRWFGV